MKSGDSRNNKAPGVSIDEALEMFLSISYPQGIPEEINKEELYRVLREKISQDRPEWAQKSGVGTSAVPHQHPNSGQANSHRYSQLKQAVYDKANKSDIPDDPQERYLYERNQEALANLTRKKEEEKEEEKNRALRQKLIDQNKSQPDEINRKNLEIAQENLLGQNVRQDRPQFTMDADFAGLQVSGQDMDLEPGQDDATQKQLQFFKQVEKLDRAGRIEAMQAFNQSRRKLIGTKSDSLKPRHSFDYKGDERFSLDTGKVKEKKSNIEEQGEKYLNYIRTKRSKSTSVDDSGLRFSSGKGRGLELE